MRLRQFTDFGLRACMRMASEPDRAFTTTELADEFAVSRNHLTKTVAALAHAGIVVTRRGTGGGAMLARPAHDISVGQVVAVLEHDTSVVECFQPDGGACTLTPQCRLKGMLFQAQLRFIAALDDYTLADCALPPREKVRNGHNI